MDHSSTAVWARVDEDFFVASGNGEFWGTVDRRPDGSFVARDMHSVVLGIHGSLGDAMAAVADRSHGGR